MIPFSFYKPNFVLPIDVKLAEAVEHEKFAEVSNDYLAAAVNKI